MSMNYLENPRITQHITDNPDLINTFPTEVMKEKIVEDKIPKIMNLLDSGQKLKNEQVNLVLTKVSGIEAIDILHIYNNRLHSSHKMNHWKCRVVNLRVAKKFTEFGIAPAWRCYRLPEGDSSDETVSNEFIKLSDLRIIDLQWLHAKYRNDDFLVTGSNGLYLELMSKDSFDHELAYKLATQEGNRDTHIEYLGVSEDIQKELVAYRTLAIQQEQKRVIDLRVDVENDLKLAAKLNPRMGKKLLEVIPDRLNQWMSTQISPTNSKAVMYQTYKKMTGSSITLSSYITKYQSLKNALRLAGNKFRI